jgi:glucose/arabinose dehydrogenase
MTGRKALRRIGITVVTLLTALIAFAWFGPVTVGNKKLLLDFLLGRGIAPPSPALVTQRLRVADGFHVELYSADVPLARWPLATAAGDLVVARTRADEIVIVERDRDGDGKPDAVRRLLGDLEHPHGLALHEGWLYVGEGTGIGRIRFDETTGRTTGSYRRVVDDLTDDGFHGTKTIGFGPDGWLYVAQGSSCNVCLEQDERRATIMRMRPDGTEREIYARGLRNSVGFDWAPWDGSLYATENGRDLLGDDFPPDELNRIERGRFYGWPYVNGFGAPDPDMQPSNVARGLVDRATPPVHGFRAHNAPLGIQFLRGDMPSAYQRTAVVALHGSWNRRTLDGYKVVSLHFQPDGSIVERDFLTGFLGDDGILGRPAGVTQGTDGSIFVADDYAGVIYRIVRDEVTRRE